MVVAEVSDDFAMFTIGSAVIVLGEDRVAVIVDTRPSVADREVFDLYIHFANSDRRLDRWVSQRQVRAHTPTPTTAEIGAEDRRVTRGIGFAKSVDDDKAHEDDGEKPKIKNIENVVVMCPMRLSSSLSSASSMIVELSSAWELACWYYSPYPHPRQSLYLCGLCFHYCVNQQSLVDHWMAECRLHHPPGCEIYREMDRRISVFEVDGEQHRLYCQRLCLFAKLFIEHKTAVFDVEPFLFYVVGEWMDGGFNLVGYFSKEKYSVECNNVACILTWPHQQRKGYGRFLIELSYQLSVIEGKPGSPEKPLSDLGALSYRRYWLSALLAAFATHSEGAVISVDDVSARTGIRRDDLIALAREFDLVRYVKGQHCLHCNRPKVETLRAASKTSTGGNGGAMPFDANKLRWTPPIFPKKQRGFAM